MAFMVYPYKSNATDVVLYLTHTVSSLDNKGSA